MSGISNHTALLLLRVQAEAIDGSHFGAAAAEGNYFPRDFPCGLSITVERDHQNNCLLVFANRPEPDHVLQHLFLREPPLWRADADSKEWSAIRRQSQEEADWNMFRQDDAGNIFPVFTHLYEQEARCILRLFEERGHKQIYWTERSDH